MAEYAVFLYAPSDAQDVTPEELAEHDRHGAELAASGAMVFGRALAQPEHSTSLRPDSVTDGPFLDTKEIVVGFYVVSADDLDAALAIVKQNPILRQGGGLEVRPIAE